MKDGQSYDSGVALADTRHLLERQSLCGGLIRARYPGYYAVLIGLVVVAIGLLDWWTGADVSLALVYIVLVAAAGWFIGRNSALALSALAGLAWFAADFVLREPGYLPVSTWNAVTRLGIFAGSGLVMDVLRREREKLCLLLDRLAALHEREATNARTDVLTGLHNGRSFYEALEREWARFIRHGQPVSLAFIDVDNFKSINDQHGHEQGDVLLQRLAKSLVESVRQEDITGRLGGDEFAVLLPGSSADDALGIMERYQVRVRSIAQEYPGSELGVSVGIAAASKHLDGSRALVKAADAIMYHVKASGKSGIAVDACTEG